MKQKDRSKHFNSKSEVRIHLTKPEVAPEGLLNLLSPPAGCTGNLSHVYIMRSNCMGSGSHPACILTLFRDDTTSPSGRKLSMHAPFLLTVVAVGMGNEHASQKKLQHTPTRFYSWTFETCILGAPQSRAASGCSLMCLAWNICGQI